MANPWLHIPAEDYEAHMVLPEVAQRKPLNELFAAVLAEHVPASLALFGCATGNGLEHVDPARTRRVVAIDINPAYLRILGERFSARLAGLEVTAADFTSASFRIEPVSLIFAALVFEYVDVGKAVRTITRCLAPGGMLVAALQLPSSESAPVTPTPYISLKRLAPIMNLVPPAEFSEACASVGLHSAKMQTIPLPQGKAFFVGHYRKAAGPDADGAIPERAICAGF